MGDQINEIIYQQMLKLKEQTAFIQQFELMYKLQDEEVQLMREECLAERVAISKLKQTSHDKDENNQDIKTF